MSRDARYGRRGGGWAETRSGGDVCRVCRNSTARWEAHHRQRDEQWIVCTTCKAQTERYRVAVDLVPLTPDPAEHAGPAERDELSIWHTPEERAA